MKNIFLCAVLLFSGSLFVRAQTYLLDIHAGATASIIHGETARHYGPQFGLLVGMRLKLFSLSKTIGLNVEGNFSQQGGGYETPQVATDEGRFGKLKLNYINVPVFLRFQSKGGLFFCDAGMQAGYLLSANDKFSTLFGRLSRDVKDFASELDFALIAGGGYQFGKRFGAGLRVSYGLSNIFIEDNTWWENKDRNLVLSLQLNYNL